MSSGGIFLLQPDKSLIRMDEQPYDSEVLLQQLLEQYPDLLAGDQMNPDAPRKWLLVKREMSVPGEHNGSGRWSLDHLFLDQDGVPTLVEVKRSTDTRMRREVVGQMLDYAANGVVYWSVERIQTELDSTARNAGRDLSEVLGEFLGGQEDEAAFWMRVKSNLQAGRLRMVFVADVIPNELRRIVEFLNEQLDPAEVFAVEIRQYAGTGLTSLIPRVIGQTAEAQVRKTAGSTRQWTEDTFKLMDAVIERSREPGQAPVPVTVTSI
jgi:hypothetical protein